MRDLEEARVKVVAQTQVNLRKAFTRGRAARNQQSPKSFRRLIGVLKVGKRRKSYWSDP